MVVDKTLPQLAWLNPSHQRSFEDARVEFRSANLINANSAANAMQGDFHYVINLAAETRFGQFDQVYEEGVFRLSLNCAKLAVNQPSLRRFVEISTAMVSSETPANENCKVMPLSPIGKSKARVEKEISQIDGKKYRLVLATLNRFNLTKQKHISTK